MEYRVPDQSMNELSSSFICQPLWNLLLLNGAFSRKQNLLFFFPLRCLEDSLSPMIWRPTGRWGQASEKS